MGLIILYLNTSFACLLVGHARLQGSRAKKSIGKAYWRKSKEKLAPPPFGPPLVYED